MEILLFVLLSLQLLFAIFKLRTFVHPIIILKFYCVLSAFVLIFFSSVWGLKITLNTVMIFATGLLWVDFGFFIGSIFNGRKKKIRNETNKNNQVIENEQKREFSIATSLIILTFIVLIIFIYLRYGKEYIQLGNGIEDFSKSVVMLKAGRRSGDVEELGFWQYGITASTILGIVYGYVCVTEWVQKDGFNKRILIFILPVVAVFFLFFMTGRRSFLLKLILLILVLIYEYNVRKYKKIPLKIQLKFFVGAIILLVGFYSFFITAGQLLLKGSALNISSFNSFAIYLSGGIVSFDKVYKNYTLTSEVFGQNILRILYKLLNLLPGVYIPISETIKSSFYSGNNFVTNVYTVNLPYMADFGYIGVIIGNMLIGIFYSILYFKSKKEKNIGFWNVVYAFFLTTLLSYTGSERYFVPMTLNIQYIIVFYIFLKTSILYSNKKI